MLDASSAEAEKKGTSVLPRGRSLFAIRQKKKKVN
jgi:hypothetical protein